MLVPVTVGAYEMQVPASLADLSSQVDRRATALSSLAKKTLKALIVHAKTRNLGEPVFPSVNRLAQMLDASKPTVYRGLHELAELGYVRRLQARKRGQRFSVARTILSPLVASWSNLPYSLPPEQLSFFENPGQAVRAAMKTVVSATSEALQNMFRLVSVYRQGQRANLPEDLVFLIDLGVEIRLVMCLMRKLTAARKQGITPENLSTICQKRKMALMRARNPAAYLQFLVREALEGRKIGEFVPAKTPEQEQEERDRIRNEKMLIHRQYQHTITYRESNDTWLKIENDLCAYVYARHPGQHPESRQPGAMSLLDFRELIQKEGLKPEKIESTFDPRWRERTHPPEDVQVEQEGGPPQEDHSILDDVFRRLREVLR